MAFAVQSPPFYYPHNFVAADFDVYWSYVDPNQISLTPGLISYLQDKAAPWPDAAAVYTSPRTIVLTVSQDGEKRARLWLQKELSAAPPHRLNLRHQLYRCPRHLPQQHLPGFRYPHHPGILPPFPA